MCIEDRQLTVLCNGHQQDDIPLSYTVKQNVSVDIIDPPLLPKNLIIKSGVVHQVYSVVY